MRQSKGNSPNKSYFGNSLVVQRLGHHTFTAEGLGSIPGQGTKTPRAKKQKKRERKKKKKKRKDMQPFIR